jgi:2-polyprenyl-3-methyl-5-hydroxy-6-metoxy-1,4-benzoquinol methylase
MERERRPLEDAVRPVEDAEREFFAGYYAEQRYNPTGWRLRLERDARIVRAAAPGGRLGRVLSVGCGDGQLELMLAPAARSVLGVDISPEAIAVARRAAAREDVSNVEFRCVSLADLDVSERFDTVVCVAFLHHLPAAGVAPFLDFVAAHLAPGGLLYTQDPNVHGLLRRVGRLVLGRRYDAYHSPDERELDPGEVVAALRAAGFVSVTLRYVDTTLIPMVYAARQGPAPLFHACAAFDRLWCASPLARWASGFSIVARKPGKP